MKSAVHARPLQICLLIFNNLTDPCATHARHLFQSCSDMYSFKNEDKTLRMNSGWVVPRGGGGGVGVGGTWVRFCWVCAAGLSEPPPHYSLFYSQP